MRSQRTIISIIILILLSGVFFLANWSQRNTVGIFDEIRTLSVDEIVEIAIENEHEKILLINKNPAIPTASFSREVRLNEHLHWHTQAEPNVGLSSERLTNLVVNLKALNLKEDLSEKDYNKNLTVYGLDKPKRIIGVRFKSRFGGENYIRISFGNFNEYLNLYYAYLEPADKLFMLGSGLYEELSYFNFEYNSPYPFQDPLNSATKIEIIDSKQHLTLEKIGKNWLIVEPERLSINTQHFQDFLKKLKNLKVSSASKIDGEIKLPYELTFKIDSTTLNEQFVGNFISTNDDTGEAILVIEARHFMYRTEDNPIGLVSANVGEFRDRELVHFSKEKIVSVRVRKGKEDYLLTKANEKWMIDGVLADQIFVDDMLANLTKLAAEDFPDQSLEFGFKSPQAILTVDYFNQREDKKTFTLKIGNLVNKDGIDLKFYVQVDGNPEPVIISWKNLKRVFANRETLLIVDKIS